MTLARILSRTQLGVSAPLVQVELHLGRGLPNFTIVGLPAPVVRESRERVRAALVNCGYEFPAGRITVNLAPVELQKQGGRFDLPIALSLLIASGQLAAPKQAFECYGELGLAGDLRPVSGLFLAALNASRVGHSLIVPEANGGEVALTGHRSAYGASTLTDAAAQMIRPDPNSRLRTPASIEDSSRPSSAALADVIGQWQAKRALMIAAAGAHSLLMIGPPGSGKSMLASRLTSLLPSLTQADALEVAGIASVAGVPVEPSRFRQRPFRSPHHTSSAHAIVGGGASVKPGEISLAHQGVLFLDELPEFDRRVLESLREPLETGNITIARAGSRLELPARFQLVAAMNPCPCGYLGDLKQACRCSLKRIDNYRQRVSGPLLDRIDMRIHVPRVPADELVLRAASAQSNTHPDPFAQVQAARARRESISGALSARLAPAQLRGCCRLEESAQQLLRRSCEQLQLSGRGMHRLLALSRTIADLADCDTIEMPHLAEAIQLRRAMPAY
jgi:magnesium chelatase family protein